MVGIDSDAVSLAMARERVPGARFVHGDVMAYPFDEASFDLVSVVATLHHLPLAPALARFRQLLRPRGVLVVIGLYRAHSLLDYTNAAVALPLSHAIRAFRREAPVGAPLADPRETMEEVRAACLGEMPGGEFRRRLFFRYSFVWRKPQVC